MTDVAPAASAADPGLPPLAREVFGNISEREQMLFYGVAALALLLLAWGVARRVRLWRLGRATGGPLAWGRVARQLATDVLRQGRFTGGGKAKRAHWALFGGFMVLLLGTTLVAVEHTAARLLGRAASDPVFHKGAYYAIFEIAMDLAGIALLVGSAVFAHRRWHGGRRIGRAWHDWLVLGLLAAIGATGFAVEGLRIVHAPTAWPAVSPVGYAASVLLRQIDGLTAAAGGWHRVLWWTHALLALALIALFPYVRLRHALAGALHLATREPAIGTCSLVSIDQVEQTGRYGAGRIDDLSRRQLLTLDACVSCGRCDAHCPAWEAGRRLAPKTIVQGLRAHMDRAGPQLLAGRRQSERADTAELPTTLDEPTISTDAIWSCTTCSACTDTCPLGVDPAGLIVDLRRYLIGEGHLSGPPAASLQKMQRTGNPWGLPARDRMAWAKGLDVPLASDAGSVELLYWVGCAAGYDRRVGKVARSVVRLLQAANVRFAVLGEEERCTGESARRMGDEFLFQELAAANIASLERYGVRNIVTHCPHCLNTFRNDYPQLGGRYRVLHHSELLARLIESQRIPLAAGGRAGAEPMTFHDPCYLARVQGVTRPPRAVLEAARVGSADPRLTEMPRARRQTACCGAGGGRMWFDDAAEARIGAGRAVEAVETGAKTVAVGCPFCLITMHDHCQKLSSDVAVRDVAEILADALDGSADTAGSEHAASGGEGTEMA